MSGGHAAALPLEGAFALAALALLRGGRLALLAPFWLAGTLFVASEAASPAVAEPFAGWVRVAADRPDGVRRIAPQRIELIPSATIGGAPLTTTTAFLLDAGRHSRSNGDWCWVVGTLESHRPARNPGARPPPPLLQCRATVEKPPPLPPLARARRAIDRCASAIEAQLEAKLSPASAALACSLALGRSDRLAPELRASLRASGAWHLFAVSGSHVVLVAALLAWLLPRRPRAVVRAVTLASVLLFVLLSGAQPPAWRAACAHAAWWLARGRPVAPCSASVLAAAFLLLVGLFPPQLRDVGLQLSFAAVFALLVAARHGPTRSPRGTGHGIDARRPLGRALRGALFASLATAPLTAFHFGTIAWWAPLATLLLTPFVTLGLLASLVACAACFAPAPLLLPLDVSLRALDRSVAPIAAAVAALPGSAVAVAAPSLLLLALLGASWLALFGRCAKAAIALASAALILSLRSADPPAPLTLLDVGHGQAALLRSSTRCDLVDAGGSDADAGETLVAALRAMGIARLDALVLSHLDADHCGAADAVVAALDVGEVVVTPAAASELATAESEGLRRLRDALAQRGVAVRRVVAGETVGPHEVVWPPRDRTFAARNDGSLALAARIDGARLLFPGDLEGYPLVELAQSLGDAPPFDLVVLPHHGNRDPGLEPFVERCRTTRAFVSRSTRELPSATEQALGAAGIAWRSTARSGALSWPAKKP